MSKYAELFKGAAGETAVMERNEPIEEGSRQKQEYFTLLLVDDEEGVLKAVRRVFLEENYEILTAKSADEALAVMETKKVHLVISDHRMPGMTGAELLKEIKEQWPETIRIMLTGHADIQAIMGAVNDGAVYKFITKPWNDEDLRLTVSLAFQQHALMQENKKLKEITKKQELKIKNYSALSNEDRGAIGKILTKSGVIKKEDLDSA